MQWYAVTDNALMHISNFLCSSWNRDQSPCVAGTHILVVFQTLLHFTCDFGSLKADIFNLIITGFYKRGFFGGKLKSKTNLQKN